MPKNIYILDGMVADINKECHDYDQLIKNNNNELYITTFYFKQ